MSENLCVLKGDFSLIYDNLPFQEHLVEFIMAQYCGKTRRKRVESRRSSWKLSQVGHLLLYTPKKPSLFLVTWRTLFFLPDPKLFPPGKKAHGWAYNTRVSGRERERKREREKRRRKRRRMRGNYLLAYPSSFYLFFFFFPEARNKEFPPFFFLLCFAVQYSFVLV